MATRKTHKDAAETEVAESEELVSLRTQVSELTDKLDLAEKSTVAAAFVYEQEVKRLNDLVHHLQHTAPQKSPDTPRGALALIITKLEDVAVGGVAADLRSTVHTAAAYLSSADKQMLQEFAARLRSATEAVAQETSTLLL
jgi:hypothetical protein